MKTFKHFFAVSLALLLGASAFAQAPANDSCGGAVALTIGTPLSPGFITGNNDSATTSAGDTNTCWGTGMSHTVWYSFTVTTAGSYTITTVASDGSSPDTQLELFSGSCGSLSPIDCNEDAAASCGDGFAAEITRTLTAGTYYVMVDIYDAATGNFQIAVIFNDYATTDAYDCIGAAADLNFVQTILDGGATHGCTDVYNYYNVGQEEIFTNGSGNADYSGCNNNPEVTPFFGVWFSFVYNIEKPNAWLSVHPVATPQCDGGESENIFYTLHLFKGTTDLDCDSVRFGTGTDGQGWCSVGDSDYSENDVRGTRDKAGNCFYDHPRLNIGTLEDGKTYYVMVAQMTRYTVTVDTVQTLVGYDPITGQPIYVPVVTSVNTIAAPDNGLFYLTYELDTNSADSCPGAIALGSSSGAAYTNAGATGNIQTSPYGTPAPIAGEPTGYNGGGGGGPLVGCSPDSAVEVGAILAWENHNSALYTFTINEPSGTDTLCVTVEELEGDILDLIDILCPVLEIYTAGIPVIFDPQTGDTLLDIGGTLATIYGNDTIKILEPWVCDSIKSLIRTLLGQLPPEVDTVCFPVNCTPRTEVYFTKTGDCCGEGSPKIAVLSDCASGNVVMWSDIDCSTSCVTLSSGLTPLSPGDYYVVVEGDGVVMDYDIWVTHTYSYGLGGAPCDPDGIGSRTASGIAKHNQSLNNIQLQPVPASNELTVKFTANSSVNQVRFSVVDMTGKQVIATQKVDAAKGTNEYTIDVSALSSGMYLLRFDNNGERVVTKFSVAK